MSFTLGIFAGPDAGSTAGAGGNVAPRRDALLRALDVDDDGSMTFEIGRPETGATCVLVDETGTGGGFEVHLPLIRSPTSAHDLLPALVGALGSIGAFLVTADEITRGRAAAPRTADDLLDAWTRAHVDACRELARVCTAQGLPPPPHMPLEELTRLHGWLLAIAPLDDVAQPILGLDPADGSPTKIAVGLPDVVREAGTAPSSGASGGWRGGGLLRIPPVHAVLANVDGETRVFPLEAVGTPGADGFVVVDLATLKLEGGDPLGRTRVVSPVEIVDSEALSSP